MSDVQSALRGISNSGLVTVTEAGVQGMITLRGDAGAAGVGPAVEKVVGAGLPETRAMSIGDNASIAWMSPDEWLILCPYAEAHGTVAALRAALAGTHHLVENVSDARALFTLEGDDSRVRETLAKLAPVDLHPARFAPGEVRRTRFAQVPGALWIERAGSARVVCFRSVARYVFDLLSGAGGSHGAVDHFD